MVLGGFRSFLLLVTTNFEPGHTKYYREEMQSISTNSETYVS